MPILYIHGVAMREESHEDWSVVKPFVQSVEWTAVQEKLRQYIAPVLGIQSPRDVLVQQVYWGDLGAAPIQSRGDDEEDRPAPSRLPPDELAERLERRLRRAMPDQAWPDVIDAVWEVSYDQALRPAWENLAPEQQWSFLHQQIETEMRRRWRSQYPLDPWPKHLQWGQGLRVRLAKRVAQLRGPMEGILPYFVGDVVGYLNTRGTPEQPGPIPQRVLAALRELNAVKKQTGEPLVVVTYSMGGQIFYDAMNAFVPAQRDLQDLNVDFWCAAGSQLGLFASLGLFLQEAAKEPPTRPAQVAYLWNVWSPSDLLSFQGSHLIAGAQDLVVSLTQDAFKAHAAYLTDPLFYEALARKIKVVTTYKSPSAPAGAGQTV